MNGSRVQEAVSVESAISGRSSSRAFLPDPVPAETVRAIVRAAQQAPSWCNTQPWQLIITAGKETDRLRDALLTRVRSGVPGRYDIAPPTTYGGVYLDRRRASGLALYQSVGITRDDKAGRITQGLENFRFFGAPHVVILTTEADLGPYGLVDCGAWLQTFLIAAAAAGVDTIAQAAIAGYSDVVRDHFALPANRHVVCAVSFGHRDPDHPANQFRTERAELQEVTDLRGFADRGSHPSELAR